MTRVKTLLFRLGYKGWPIEGFIPKKKKISATEQMGRVKERRALGRERSLRKKTSKPGQSRIEQLISGSNAKVKRNARTAIDPLNSDNVRIKALKQVLLEKKRNEKYIELLKKKRSISRKQMEWNKDVIKAVKAAEKQLTVADVAELEREASAEADKLFEKAEKLDVEKKKKEEEEQAPARRLRARNSRREAGVRKERSLTWKWEKRGARKTRNKGEEEEEAKPATASRGRKRKRATKKSTRKRTAVK